MYHLQSAQSEDKSLAKKPPKRSVRGSGKSTVDKETKDTTMRDAATAIITAPGVLIYHF